MLKDRLFRGRKTGTFTLHDGNRDQVVPWHNNCLGAGKRPANLGHGI